MNYDKQYYILERQNNDNYPLLEWDESRNVVDDDLFDDLEYLLPQELISLAVAEPIPENPELVDYHYLPPDVFSGKVAEILGGLELIKTQLFDASIFHKNKIYSGYKIFHIFNEIQCMDLRRSVYQQHVVGYSIEKLALDHDVLDQIEEINRMVFILEEKPSKKLYHEKVVSKIMEVKPVGLQFIRLDKWDIGSAFR